MNKYQQIRTAKAGPVFIHFEGQSFTRYQFITILKQCLEIISFDYCFFVKVPSRKLIAQEALDICPIV